MEEKVRKYLQQNQTRLEPASLVAGLFGLTHGDVRIPKAKLSGLKELEMTLAKAMLMETHKVTGTQVPVRLVEEVLQRHIKEFEACYLAARKKGSIKRLFPLTSEERKTYLEDVQRFRALLESLKRQKEDARVDPSIYDKFFEAVRAHNNLATLIHLGSSKHRAYVDKRDAVMFSFFKLVHPNSLIEA